MIAKKKKEEPVVPAETPKTVAPTDIAAPSLADIDTSSAEAREAVDDLLAEFYNRLCGTSFKAGAIRDAIAPTREKILRALAISNIPITTEETG